MQPPALHVTPTRREAPVVFFAEDDAELRALLSAALRASGFDVLAAATGYEMLALLGAAARGEIVTPDAIVMDIRMPRCSGIDVLRAIRLAEWKQPIVMITGFGEPSVHERAAHYGASVVLDKPFEAEELVGMLDLLLRLAHSEVALRRGVPRSPTDGRSSQDPTE